MSTQGYACVVSARATFSTDRRTVRTAPPESGRRQGLAGRLLAAMRPRAYFRLLRSFYGERIGRIGTGVCVVVLVYGGGAAMFWFHSIHLGEGGPAISPWLHWIVDSTAGLLGLTAPIVLIVPLAASVATRSPGLPTVRSGLFAGVTGTLLAVVTAPGPLIHDAFVGRGTWLAAQATRLFGNGHEATGTPPDLSPALRMLQQIAFAIPLYVSLTWLALWAVRFALRRLTD